MTIIPCHAHHNTKNTSSLTTAITAVPLFFFSSRRRHTRCGRDWSSDVCSSDLIDEVKVDLKELREEGLPRRVSKLEADAEATREEGLPRRIRVLEDWRRNIGSRWWADRKSVV